MLVSASEGVDCQVVVAVQRVCDGGLRTRAPRVTARVGLPKEKIGVLRAHAGSGRPFAEAMEIFSEEIDLVLSLVEHVAAEIVVARAIAVGGVGCSGGEAPVGPVFYIVGFYGIGLVAVLDVGVDVGKIARSTGQLLDIVGEGAAEIERAAEIDYEHLPAGERLLPVERE